MSKSPTHMIIETGAFTTRAKKIGISATQLAAIYDLYAADPALSKVIRNTGGLRNARVAEDATGKSGGYRVFSFYADRLNPVFLLWIIDKSEDATLTKDQEKAFKQVTARLKEVLK